MAAYWWIPVAIYKCNASGAIDMMWARNRSQSSSLSMLLSFCCGAGLEVASCWWATTCSRHTTLLGSTATTSSSCDAVALSPAGWSWLWPLATGLLQLLGHCAQWHCALTIGMASLDAFPLWLPYSSLVYTCAQLRGCEGGRRVPGCMRSLWLQYSCAAASVTAQAESPGY